METVQEGRGEGKSDSKSELKVGLLIKKKIYIYLFEIQNVTLEIR